MKERKPKPWLPVLTVLWCHISSTTKALHDWRSATLGKPGTVTEEAVQSREKKSLNIYVNEQICNYTL
jgi:hypothetical protein